jgi:hypothetical protein
VSTRTAISALATHQRRCGARLSPADQAMAPQSSPSIRNQGSLNSRSCRSDSRRLTDNQNGKGRWAHTCPRFAGLRLTEVEAGVDQQTPPMDRAR